MEVDPPIVSLHLSMQSNALRSHYEAAPYIIEQNSPNGAFYHSPGQGKALLFTNALG